MNVMPIRMLSCSKCQWENKPTNTTKGHDVDDTAVERSALLSIHLFISACFLAFLLSVCAAILDKCYLVCCMCIEPCTLYICLYCC